MSSQNISDSASLAFVGGGWIVAAMDNIDSGAVLVVVGTAITVISLVWSRVVKPIYIDWRTINIDLDTKANAIVKTNVEDIVKANVADLTTKVDTLDQRITELTAKLDNWANRLSDITLPAYNPKSED